MPETITANIPFFKDDELKACRLWQHTQNGSYGVILGYWNATEFLVAEVVVCVQKKGPGLVRLSNRKKQVKDHSASV